MERGRRTYHEKHHSQSEGVYSNNHNKDYLQPPPRYYHKPREQNYPKARLSPFHGNEI